MDSGSVPPGRFAGARDVPSALRLGAAGLLILLAGVVALSLLGALILFAVPALLGVMLAAWVVRWWRGLWAPNGALDGRRNVRVVVRDGPFSRSG